MSSFYAVSFKKEGEKGYTLIELVTTIGILIFFTSTFLFNFPRLNRNIALTSAAQDMALSFREAEAQSIVVSAQTYTGPLAFPDGYGLYFDVAGNPGQYILFHDRKPSPTTASNGRYDPDPDPTVDETTKIFTLSSRLKIVKIAEINNGGSEVAKNNMTILFRRPDPLVEVRSNGGGSISGNNHFLVRIAPVDDPTNTRTIHIWSTGQIAISQN